MMMAIHPMYSLAGVLVGLLVGLTGVGGGSLMTPLLVMLFGFHPATAVGTDLLYASATKTVGTAVHGRHGTVDWRIVSRLAAGSVPFAVVTLVVLGRLGEHSAKAGHVISILLGLALLAAAVATFLRGRIVALLAPRFERISQARVAWATIGLGAVLGILVPLTSVGAGALGMTALLVLYPQVAVNRLVGSDIAHAVPLTLVAGIGHLMLGSVDVGLLVSLMIGSVPGIVVGSLLAARASDRLLRPILGTVLAIVGIKMLF